MATAFLEVEQHADNTFDSSLVRSSFKIKKPQKYQLFFCLGASFKLKKRNPHPTPQRNRFFAPSNSSKIEKKHTQMASATPSKIKPKRYTKIPLSCLLFLVTNEKGTYFCKIALTQTILCHCGEVPQSLAAPNTRATG